MPSEGERFYPPSHGNETQPRADGGGGRGKRDCRMKRKMREFTSRKEKKVLNGWSLSGDLTEQTSKQSTRQTTRALQGFEARLFSRPTWF